MKKFVKISILVSCSFVLLGALIAFTYLMSNFVKYSNLPLNNASLTDSSLNIEIYDNSNKIIDEQNNFNRRYVKLSNLQEHTKNAFISIEDKAFYKHHGINKKRIAKAFINNLKSFNLKEGASTISQQLIKNTHLSSEKTITRKIKEVVLTKKLEKNYSKDEILEFYLNIIYFGNNCYGIDNASYYYFSKPSNKLNLEESCVLAGMINSPYKYSPIINYENSLKRRNIVISQMSKDGFITESEAMEAKSKPISLDLKTEYDNKINSYSEASIDEAVSILKMPAKQIALGGYKIHTYQDLEKQKVLNESLKIFEDENCDNAGIVIDSHKHGVVAYSGKSAYKILDAKRQPGSTIKPVLVYAPALNEDIVTPETQILDEEIKIEDYKPNNFGNKFHGYVSIRESINQSINIPAIKVMNYVGIENCKDYAKKLGINFDEKDYNYSIALGGMTYGCNLKTLANSYSAFNNKGMYDDAKFISYITDSNNRLVYIHKPKETRVFREDTTYLMTDMLKDTAKKGTARKLSDLNIEIASKTGTVEKPNSNKNLDAYNISYTPNEVIGIWCGNLDNKEINISGSGKPTLAVKNYLSKQEITDTFEKPTTVAEVEIDELELVKNHRLVLANPNSPERFKKKVLFSRFNTPEELSSNFYNKPDIDITSNQEDGMVNFKLNPEKHINYKIYKNEIEDKNMLKEIKEKNEEIDLSFDLDENENKIIVVATYNNMENSPESIKCFDCYKTSKLKKNITNKTKNSNKWYI